MKPLIFLFFLCLCNIISGQHKTLLKGVVANESGQPEDFVIITRLNISDSTIVDYQFSDKNGRFTFNNIGDKDNVILLSFSKLGFIKIFQSYSFVKGVENDLGIVKLKPESYLLNEIVINEKAPKLIEKGDTTSYQASMFTDGTERKVEDVLKKIPGISIDENGNIKYQNKAIDRVLIEGDDLMGSNYTVGTRTIQAAVVDKVEVIDHYLDNPLMKAIVTSNKTVLNIKVGEGFKNATNGNLETGMGGPSAFKYYQSITAISLMKKTKMLSTAISDNIRSASLGNVDYYFENFSSHQNNDFPSSVTTTQLLRAPSFMELNIPEVLTSTGNQSLGSFNGMKKFNNGWKMTLSGVGGFKVRKNITEESAQYFQQKDTLTFEDKNILSNRETPLKVRLLSEYISLEKGYSIRSISTYFNQSKNYKYNLTRNLSNALQSELNVTPTGIKNYSEYTKKINSGLMQISTDFSYMKQSEDAFYTNPIFTSGVIPGVQTSDLIQKVPSEITHLVVTSKWMLRKKINMDINVGYQFNHSIIHSSIQDADILLSSFYNNISRHENVIFSNFKVFYNLRYATLNLALLTSSNFLNVRNNETIHVDNFLLVSPNLTGEISLGRKWYLNINSGIRQSLSGTQNMLLNPVLTNFQTLYYGTPEILKSQTFKTEMSIRKNDLFRGYYIVGSLHHSYHSNDFGFVSDFSQILFRQSLFFPVTSISSGVDFNALYILDFIKSKVECTAKVNVYQTVNNINAQQRNILVKSQSYKLKMTTLLHNINISVQHEFDQNTWINNQVTTTIPLTTQNTEFSLKVLPTKSLNITARGNYLHINSISTSAYRTLSVDMNYTPQKKLKNQTFQLSFTNPFDDKHFSTNTASDYYYFSSKILAVRRFVLFSWNYTF
jgi:hypothetical protein